MKPLPHPHRVAAGYRPADGRIFTTSEIAAMRPDEFAAHKDEILRQQAAGLIVADTPEAKAWEAQARADAALIGYAGRVKAPTDTGP